uniref:Protein CR006 P-loop domain-containing protein n=1 Tax=Nitratidesulfovibrio vulgaris (strain DSM 19637 / Miyazaki F) TaxID=883 RepID=B8DMH4_NITV9
MLKRYISLDCDFLKTEWERGTPDFSKFNLIFGWNGSGKTTFSKILSHISQKTIPSNWNMRLLFDHGCFDRRSILSSDNKFDIKVFNSKAIQDMFFTEKTPIAPVVYIGKGDSSLARRRVALQKGYNKLAAYKRKITDEISTIKLDSLFTDVGRAIRNNAQCPMNMTYRNFDKRDVEQIFRDFADGTTPDGAKLLTVDEYDTITQKKNSTYKKPIIIQPLPDIDFKKITDNCRDTLSKTASTISEIEINKAFRDWVESGFSLHKSHNMSQCQLCGNQISSDRQKTLSEIFTDAHNDILRSITIQQDLISKNINAIKDWEASVPHPATLFDHYTEKYSIAFALVKEKIDFACEEMRTLSTLLEQKKHNTDKKQVHSLHTPHISNDCLKELFSIALLHNNESDNHSRCVENAQSMIASHHILENFEIYTQKTNQFTYLTDRQKNISIALEKTDKKLNHISAQVKDTLKPAHELTTELADYLGRKELEFTVEQNGYIIRRNGTVISDLSDGEKTAIAYLYFLKSLSDESNDISSSIIVIDDPVSSLDTNALYNAYSYTKEKTINAHQLFILTHNYMFFRLIKSWITREHDSENNKLCGIYTFETFFSSGTRSSKLTKTRQVFKDYETEYHYLFETCYKCCISCSPEKCGEKCYMLPNVARRVLETFLSFSFPTKTSLSQMVLAHPHLTSTEKNVLYSLTNDYSHSCIPGRDYYDRTVLENIPLIMRLVIKAIETLNEQHFIGMKKTLGLADIPELTT